MNEFIEKLIGRLEEEKEGAKKRNAFDSELSYKRAIEIVNQLAEEYKHCALCYLQSPCEYQNENAILQDELLADKSGWIPCSSGTMPKENEKIMLTFKNSAGLHVGEATYKNKMFFYVTDTEFGYYEEVYKNPIAWKPKDAPYQPKGE